MRKEKLFKKSDALLKILEINTGNEDILMEDVILSWWLLSSVSGIK